MSEPKLISPMLDNFAMGEPISSHHGVRCCPAMRQDSDDRYIVKVISIPASQVQLDALLLSGAYDDSTAALQYFKTLSQDVVEEAKVLSQLSKLEGFIAYDDCQIVQMENEVGYDVYLLSPYRRSLARHMQKNTLTHLGVVNLGLDICAALAVCRQAGYLYVDLKPENIFLTGENEYRIADLGFVKLDNLKFASLPDKYRSAYTAPEIADAYSSINTTVDVYAAGMILYQAYNGGMLPSALTDGESQLQAPAYADYEIAEIILKAIDPDPQNRWQDPIAMGQALISYMQRNGVNDDPIVPLAPAYEEEPAQFEEEPAVDETCDDALAENCEDQQGQVYISEVVNEDQLPADDTVADSAEIEEPSSEALSDDADIDNLSFLDTEISDDTAPDDDTVGDITYEEVSDDVSNMLSQADELIAHQTPDPVVAPEPIDVQLPPQVEEAETSSTELPDESNVAQQDAATEGEENNDDQQQQDYSAQTDDAEAYDDNDSYEPLDKKSGKRLAAIFIALILLAGLLFGGYIFYRDYYLQTVTSMTLSGSDDQLIVNIASDIDESLLTVICTDIHGNKLEENVKNGAAVFNGLNPNTLYTVKLKISGLRKLTGDVTQNYSTPTQTSIVNLSAVTGNEEGSVIISFNVDGNEPESWKIKYVDNNELITKTFTEHMVTINGLTIGETYVFQLESESAAFLSGDTQVEYTAATPVYAQNLTLNLLNKSSVLVSWNSPQETMVSKWVVRCYSESGYNKSVTTAETNVTFDELDSSNAYTVEVIAENMSAGVRSYITQEAVVIDTIDCNVVGGNISLSWKTAKTPPNAKWMVVYTIDGITDQEVKVIRTDSTSATIAPAIPGCNYNISIQLENGTTVFNGSITKEVPEAAAFNGHASGYIVSNANIQFSMCRQPASANWTYRDVPAENYTNTFAVGEKAGFVMYVPSRYNTSADNITALFVIRGEDGKIASYGTSTQPWREMWYQRYGELNMPALPETPGNYSVDIYFNGQIAHTQEFVITG